MGSSARKKKEKKKDFQKPKFKVGKAKPKPDNFTDTSFKSKSIVLKEQSIHATAPSATVQFTHHLSLLSSRSDAQRRDSLGFLHHALTDPRRLSRPTPEPAAAFLPKLLPLILDGSPSVRAQLLKVLSALPAADVEGSAEAVLPYARAGMTHLAADIRCSALEVLDWAMAEAGRELVSCAGGWVKTIKSFLAVLSWSPAEEAGKGASWTASKASFGKARSGGKPMAKCLTTFAAFLRLGLIETNQPGPSGGPGPTFPLWQVRQHTLPRRSNCYSYLGLFGTSMDEENEMFEDCEARIRIFDSKFRRAVEEGFEAARREGGEVGRAAAVGTEVLRQGLSQLEETMQT